MLTTHSSKPGCSLLRSRLTLGGLLLLMLSLLLSACGDATPASPTSQGSPPTVSSAVKSHYKMVAVIKTLSNEFWQTMKRGYEEAGQELGVDLEIISVPSEQDAAKQLELLDAALSRNPDAILVSPVTATNLLPALSKATARGIPIINVDEKLDLAAAKENNVRVNTVIASDNVHAGGLAAQWMIDNLKNGKVLLLEGKSGNPSGLDRKLGFNLTLAKDSRFTLVASLPADWDRAKAQSVVAGVLQQNPDLVAIYAANDTMALGAMDAIKAAGKTNQIAIVGTDAIPEARQAIKAGTMKATVAQFPDEEAHIGVESALKVLDKRPLNDYIPAPVKLITKEDA